MAILLLPRSRNFELSGSHFLGTKGLIKINLVFLVTCLVIGRFDTVRSTQRNFMSQD
jgi:hypothetical protein